MNVIYFDLDTVRADHLSCYGYPRLTTPFIDSVAAESVLFTNCVAVNVPTHPSHTTLLTGLHGMRHGVLAHSGRRKGESDTVDRAPLLPELLSERGVDTCAVDNLYPAKHWFARGYRHYIRMEGHTFFEGNDVTRQAVKWLRNREDPARPFFLFLHYWDAHAPYCLNPPYEFTFYDASRDPCDPHNNSLDEMKSQFVYSSYQRAAQHKYYRNGKVTDADYIVAQYDAGLRQVDGYIERVCSEVRRLGVWDDTVVVVAADHGESLTEHGIYFDHAGLHDSVVRVPLIISPPGRRGSPQVVDALVDHTDIAATLLNLFGCEQPIEWPGGVLLPSQREDSAPPKAFVICTECTWRASVAVRTTRWKLIKTLDFGVWREGEELELFDLTQDPEERCNLANDEAAVVRGLLAQLQNWLDGTLEGRANPMDLERSTMLPGQVWCAKGLSPTTKADIARVSKRLASWGY